MRRLGAYGVTCALLVLTSVAVLGSILPDGAWVGVAVAGGVASVLQVAALAARIRWATTPNRLLATWVGSMGVRAATVLLMGWAVWRFEELDVVASLVGLAGFLFVMLLMEPAFFAPGRLELDDGEIARG